MSDDVCPECGRDYIDTATIDARPGGALFETYKHDKEHMGAFMEVTDSCDHIIEWGDDADHDGGDDA